MKKSQHLYGYLLVLAGAALFSSKAIFIKLAYQETVDPLLMLTWRMIFSLPVFAVIGAYVYAIGRARGEKPPPLKMVIGAILAGLIGYYVAMLLDFQALAYITAGLERLALFTYPIFLIILGAMFLGMRLTLGHFAAGAITYAGLAFVFLADFEEAGPNVPFGTALVLASALTFAVYQLLAKNLISALGSVFFTSLALSAAAVASIAHFITVRGAFGMGASARFMALAAATGLLATAVPSFLVNAGMARIGPQSTAMISTVSPLLTIYMAVLLLGERFSLMDGVGTALVFAGVGYHTFLDLKSAKT